MPNWKTYESSVRLLSAIIAAHPGLKLDYGEMAKYFGSDCNKKAMLNVMSRNVKSDVKRLKDALAAGKDPKDIDFSEFTWGGGKGIYSIASNYGEGASENGGTPTKTKKPRAKATPKKKVKKEEAGGDDDDLEGGSDIELQTPTKGPLNKTMGGRVMKQQRTPRKTAPMNLAEDTSEDEDGAMIKYEGSGDSQHYSHAGSFNNGNGYHNGHSNGNGNGYITEGYGDSFHNVDDGDMYYAAEDGYGGGDDEVV